MYIKTIVYFPGNNKKQPYIIHYGPTLTKGAGFIIRISATK